MHSIDVTYCDRRRGVVCVCLCVRHTHVPCNMAEPIEMPFGGLTHVGPRNHVLDGVKVGRIHSQPQGVTSGDAAFCQITLGPCYTH